MAQWKQIRLGNHEVVGSIPGFAQQVKDLASKWPEVNETAIDKDLKKNRDG